MQFQQHTLQHLQQHVPHLLPLHLQPQPAGKVYMVAKHSGCIVGIESLIIMHVSPAAGQAFLNEYKGRILIEGNSKEEVLAKFNALPNG